MEEKVLSFSKQGDWYVAETEVNSDYNLHIEMDGKATLEIYQRGSNEGKYRRCYFESKWGDVIDADFHHGVYPKFLQIRVNAKVTKSTIREAGA